MCVKSLGLIPRLRSLLGSLKEYGIGVPHRRTSLSLRMAASWNQPQKKTQPRNFTNYTKNRLAVPSSFCITLTNGIQRLRSNKFSCKSWHMGMHLTPVTPICCSSGFHALPDLTLAKAAAVENLKPPIHADGRGCSSDSSASAAPCLCGQ